jgi:hypothetical protein
MIATLLFLESDPPEGSMKIVTISAVALSLFGFAHVAQAQQAAKLFFEGDIERGNQPGLPPACVLSNQFKHLEKVVWRVRVVDQNGQSLDDKGIKSLQVHLPDGQKLNARFSAHPPREPTDHFWTVAWIVPADYPNGTFAYKVVATDLQGNTHTWEPFKVHTSHFTVMAGEAEFK